MEKKVKIISKTLQENRIALALQDEDNLVHSIYVPAERESVFSLGKELILIVEDLPKEIKKPQNENPTPKQ